MTDGEMALLRDLLANLDRSLQNHIAETRESRARMAADIAKVNESLTDLRLWKSKVAGISGVISGVMAIIATALIEWARSIFHGRMNP